MGVGWHSILNNQESLAEAVFASCGKKYKSISSKVRTAIIRSVIFILLTKTLVAFAIEGTYDKYTYGKVIWSSLLLNIFIPPTLMVILGLTIKTPDKKNSERIFSRIKTILFDSEPTIGTHVNMRGKENKSAPILDFIFGILWFAAFFLSFGLVIFILSKLQFNIASQAVFIFFLAIVSFLGYRINSTAKIYTVEDKQGLLSPIINFFFIPIAQVGRYLTESISQINIFLFLFDFLIESPFKGLFGFFDQWFYYLHTKREYLE